MNENKTNINWLVILFATLSRNAYRIRICKDSHHAYLI